ncbi:DUF262 domain-containing protein [Streptomyces sp. NPDC012510]|uniref:DUF262 domain-containing protein n=1 Tax=Streptomyces sp. NPDC012510 TaxID=3364838 RepID=UPI0036EC81E3
MTGIRDGTLVPNPHFQRRLVWSNAHKVAFLRTVLDGLPFPEIFISAGEVDPETGDGTELIVDGQQRITTLYEYFTGSPLIRTGQGGVAPYKELENAQKVSFLEYEVVVRDLGPLTEAETMEIFHRINSTNYSLNAMEVNNSRFDGALKRFAQSVAEKNFFYEHRVFSSLDGRRMNDVRFALTLVISCISGYFNRDDSHEEFLERFNDEFEYEGEVSAGIDSVIRFVEECDFPHKSRVWQKSDLLTLLVELYQILIVESAKLDTYAVSRRIQAFYEEVENVTRIPDPAADAAEYYRRVRSGINDRISRINRGEALRGRILG